MSRKHEKFSWGGYKYAPESVGFSVYGKPLKLPEDVRNRLAYLACCGNNEEVKIGLKRVLRMDEKKPDIVKKCICFFKQGSNEFYYCRSFAYDQNNRQEALRCYKEWKHYIESKNCILETEFTVEDGEFDPFGNNKARRRVVENRVDLTRCRTINLVRDSIYAR